MALSFIGFPLLIHRCVSSLSPVCLYHTPMEKKIDSDQDIPGSTTLFFSSESLGGPLKARKHQL